MVTDQRWQWNEKRKIFLMLPHPLTNLEIQRYFQNEPRFESVYLRDNLINIVKNGARIVNLSEYKSTGTN